MNLLKAFFVSEVYDMSLVAFIETFRLCKSPKRNFFGVHVNKRIRAIMSVTRSIMIQHVESRVRIFDNYYLYIRSHGMLCEP